VQELQNDALNLKTDGIHPFDAIAIFRRVQTHLADGFVAFPVGLHRCQELVPGKLLGVKDEVFDGRQAVNCSGFADGLETAVVDRPGK